MTLLLFLAFSQYGLACKYGINSWINQCDCQSGKAIIQCAFQIKDVFSLYIFQVDFVLKIGNRI